MGGHITPDSKLWRHEKEKLAMKSAMIAFQLMWGDQSMHTGFLLEAETRVSSLVPQVYIHTHMQTHRHVHMHEVCTCGGQS